MIHYIQPYSTAKNIGGSINQSIKQLNAGQQDWVVLTDHDTLWLRPDSKYQLEHILNNTDYDLLGPVTNRLANHYQLASGMFDEYDIRKHIEVANKLHSENYGLIMPYTHVLAAFCLCFRVETWQKIGGFTENNIVFDTNFCQKAVQLKMRLGLMIGIYMFHPYRMGSLNPARDIKHLLP